jgi:malto-oligosyltrehalose trehalohydrolase
MRSRFAHQMPFGAEVGNGGARFRLWAPTQTSVALAVAQTGATLPMQKVGDGWFELLTDAVAIGQGYRFVLADGMCVPDPAARAQLGDVHGPSRLVDPRGFAWQTPGWTGRPWHEAVIYELHPGTFSGDGTFDGIARELDRLADLGITAIELMPVAQFAGNRGWGYDGVLMFAPHIAYGGPEGLKSLIDAAHARGLMVLLDVVYNHFGPDGNYLPLIAPQFFDARRNTPWGAAIAFMQRPVRDFFLHNVLYWLKEFRFDGLRFDAIDHIEDGSEEPILAEIARQVRDRFPDRHVHLTSEDDYNSTSLLEFDEKGRPLLFTAEWNDDWHHAVHALITGECDGYYQDYADVPAKRVADTLATGFGYQGEPSAYRGGRNRGDPSAHLPPTAFINFLQNHDQAGNRAFGERIASLTRPEANEAALALLLLSPQIPLLFMGEEYGERGPFQFFTDFETELAEAVRTGRREEFRRSKVFAEAFAHDAIPDPNSLATFAASRLDLDGADPAERAARLSLIKRLLAARREHIVPQLGSLGGHAGKVEALNGGAFSVSWQLRDSGSLAVAANLAGSEASLPAHKDGTLVFEHPDGAASALAQATLPPWSVVCRLTLESRGVARAR